ncbi:MAG: NADPH-dependent FMN reductase [Candidatus Saccharimonadales bacterium]
MTDIAVFVGSIREKSFNKQLAQHIERLAPTDTTFTYVDIASLPHFNEELEAEYPASAQAIKDIVEKADGVLFATPEYNRGIPGVLKNAIDWASRPWGTNSFAGKPVAVVGASGGALGTLAAQTQLRSVMVYLDAKIMGQPEVYVTMAGSVFHNDGTIDEAMTERLANVGAKFVERITTSK